MMACSAQITENNGCLMVAGNLNFSTVVKLWHASLNLLEKNTALNFNLSKVTSANSAGLALLLEWQRYAKKNNKTISFNHMPTQLLSIAAVAGVNHLIKP